MYNPSELKKGDILNFCGNLYKFLRVSDNKYYTFLVLKDGSEQSVKDLNTNGINMGCNPLIEEV